MAMAADAAAGPGVLHVSVCYALPDRAWLREVAVPPGTTALDAIDASGFGAAWPGVDPLAHGLAVYGQPCAPDQVLRDGDRVDILRPLAFDPKESRRRRAAHRKTVVAQAADPYNHSATTPASAIRYQAKAR